MALPQWMVIRDQLLGARPEEEIEAKADEALMADASDLISPEDSAVELPSYPVGTSKVLERVPVPEVKLKAIAPPEHQDPDFSPVGGHIDAPPAEADPVDWSARVQGARGDADRVRLAAGIGRAGEAVNAALGGRKADGSAYNGLDAHANAIEERPDVDIKLDEMSRKYREAQAIRNPNHPVNQRARAATPKAFAAMLGDAFNTMTAADLAKQFPVLKEAFKVQAAGRKQDWAEQKDAANMSNDAQVKQAQLAGQADQRGINAYAVTNNPNIIAPGGTSPVDRRFITTAVQNLGKESAKYAELGNALEQIEKSAPGLVTKGVLPASIKNSVSVVDRALLAAPGGVGTWLASPQGVEFGKLLTQAKDLVIRARSGAAITDSEAARYDKLFSTGWANNPEAVGPALNSLAQLVRSKFRSMQSGFEDDAHGLAAMPYYKGPKYTDPFWTSVSGGKPMSSNPVRDAAKPALDAAGKIGAKSVGTTIKMINKATGELAELSPEDAIEAMKEGFTRVTQ